MNYDEACKIAKTGKKLFIPGWNGYCIWDYGNQKLVFKNKDYRTYNIENQNFLQII